MDKTLIRYHNVFSLYLDCGSYSTIFQPNKWFKNLNCALFIALYRLQFQSTEKFHLDISGWLNKPITPRTCGFALANLQYVPIVDFVPSLKCQKTADCVSKYSRVMIFAAIEPPQHIVIPPTIDKRIDRHDQGFDDFAVGGFGRWSIGLRTSTKPIFQRNS